jgi:hypothetical protein
MASAPSPTGRVRCSQNLLDACWSRIFTAAGLITGHQQRRLAFTQEPSLCCTSASGRRRQVAGSSQRRRRAHQLLPTSKIFARRDCRSVSIGLAPDQGAAGALSAARALG